MTLSNFNKSTKPKTRRKYFCRKHEKSTKLQLGHLFADTHEDAVHSTRRLESQLITSTESIKFWGYIGRAPAASVTAVRQSPDTAEPNPNHDGHDPLLVPPFPSPLSGEPIRVNIV